MISKKEDVAIGNAIWIMMERIEEHCKRIYNKKMNRRRQEPDMVDAHPYPYFSMPIRRMDYQLESMEPQAFSDYSFKIGLLIILMNGARLEVLYKIKKGDILVFNHPTTGET